MRIIRGKRFDSVSNTESTWAGDGGGDGGSLPPAPTPRSVRRGAARRGAAASEYAVLVNVSPRTDLTWLAIIK